MQLERAMDVFLPGTLWSFALQWAPVEALPSIRRTSQNFHSIVSGLLRSDCNLANALERHFAKALNSSCAKRVWVGVRLKPGKEDRVRLHHVRNSLTVPTANDNRAFFFDTVFAPSAKQEDVWAAVSGPLMRCILREEDCCILAYGQTGSGKTHTMFGQPELSGGEGLAYRTARNLAELLRRQVRQDGDQNLPVVELSFLEVYNEATYDLLNRQKPVPLRAERSLLRDAGKFHGSVYSREERVVPQGLTRRKCNLECMEDQVLHLLQAGAASRTVGKTAFNPRSSRSHAVATLHITLPKSRKAAEAVETPPRPAQVFGFRPRPRVDSNPVPTVEAQPAKFRLHLVDLAGSERAGQHALSKKQLSEGVNINKSLTTLGRVVGALARGKGEHVPHRDSALTWLLSDCITGRNARAFMIAAVDPSRMAETCSTLRYAEQYSTLQSDLSSQIPQLASEVRGLQAQVLSLKRDFEMACSSAGRQPSGGWRRELLKPGRRTVMVRRNARQRVHSHPSVQWTEGHERCLQARETGIIMPAATGEDPGTEGTDPAPPPEGEEPVVEVSYLNRRGHPGGLVTLRWPESAVEEIWPPAHLRTLLANLLCLEDSLAKGKAQLAEAKERFAQQQCSWLGGP